MDVKVILELYFKLILQSEIFHTFCETGLWWVLQNPVDDKSTVV